MAFDKHTNFAISTVAVGPTPPTSGTTLTVDVGDGALFPQAPFNATVCPVGVPPSAFNAEIVRVTSVIGDVFVIVRAQEGTTPVPIDDTYQIIASITVKTITDIEAAINAGGMTALQVSAGAQNNAVTQLTFSNSNGISFGLNGSVLTASVSTTSQTNFTFSNSNGVTFGTNGSVVTASVQTNYLSNINVSAGATSGNVSAITFANSNNVTFGYSNGVVTASVNPPSGANISVSAGTTSSQVGGITFRNSNNVTFGYDGTNVTASVPNVTNSSATLSDANTSISLARLAFTNSNGLTLSLSTTTGGSATLIGSYTVPSVTNSSLTLSDNATSLTAARLAFTNLNNVTLSLSTTTGGSATLVGSIPNFLTTAAQSSQTLAFSLGGNSATTNSSQILNGGYVLAGGNNITIQQSNNTISISAANAAAQPVGVSAGTTSNNLGTIIFANSNGISFGLNTGASSQSITASYTVPTITSWTVSDAATSATVGRLAFTNSNGLTLSLSTSNNGNHTVIGSYTVPTITSATLSDANTSLTLARLAFTNSNGLTLSLSTTTGGSATLIGSYTVPNVPVATSWTVSAANASATVGRLAFTNSNGLTLSLSTSNNGNHTVIGSYTVPTVTNSTLTLSDANTSIGIARLAFTNSNGLTLSLSTTTGGSATLIGSYTVPNVPAATSWTVSDANTSATVGRLAFTNANGLTLSISTSNNGNHTVIGSYTVPSVAGLISAINLSAGTTSTNATAFTFSNANGISFGIGTGANAGVITATVQTNFLTTAALSSQTLAFSLGGNSETTNSSQILNGGYVLAGGANVTIQQSNNTISISAAAAAPSPVNVSAGTTSNNLGSIVFANANGVSFGLNTGASSQSITASIATSLTNVNLSAGTTSSNISAWTYSNANGVSFGLGTGANAGVVTASIATSLTNINISAGTTSTNASAFTFANSNGVTFGLGTGANAGVITASAAGGGGVAISNSQTLFTSGTVAFSEGGGAITIASSAGGQSLMFSVPQTSSLVGTNGINISTNGSTISVYAPIASYWANRDILIDDNSTVINTGVSALQVQPFMMPYAISGAFIRVPVSISMVSSESAATTANTTATFNRYYSQAIGIYDNNSGASSLSLSTIFTTNAAWTVQYVVGAAAQGSRYTVTQNITYPISGVTSQFTTSSAQSSANIGFSTNLLTAFTGPRFLDIPFATTLSPGNYWIGFGVSTQSATTGGLPSGLSGASMAFSYVGMSQSNLSWCVPGIAANSSVHLMPGLGSWSTNSAVMSTGSLQLASISSASSNPMMYFQIQRWA